MSECPVSSVQTPVETPEASTTAAAISNQTKPYRERLQIPQYNVVIVAYIVAVQSTLIFGESSIRKLGLARKRDWEFGWLPSTLNDDPTPMVIMT